MDIIKASVIVICAALLGATAKYGADHVRFVPTNAFDVEIAKIQAEVSMKQIRQTDDQRRYESARVQDVTAKQRCVLDLKNAVGTGHPQFMTLVDSICK